MSQDNPKNTKTTSDEKPSDESSIEMPSRDIAFHGVDFQLELCAGMACVIAMTAVALNQDYENSTFRSVQRVAEELQDRILEINQFLDTCRIIEPKGDAS